MPADSEFVPVLIKQRINDTFEEGRDLHLHYNRKAGAFVPVVTSDEGTSELGGLKGQVLAKASDAQGDVVWVNNPGAQDFELTASEFVTSGLVAGYKFDQGSGQILTDSGPNSVDGRLGATGVPEVSDPTWVSPRGLSFDGDDFVRIPNHASFRLTTAFTLEAIFNWTGNNGGIFDKTGGGVTNKNFLLYISATGAIIFRLVKSNVSVDLIGPLLSGGARYHVIASYNGTDAALWIDGSKAMQRSVVISPIDDVDGGSRIGSLGGSVFPFEGTIYKLGLYSRVLTSPETSKLFEIGLSE